MDRIDAYTKEKTKKICTTCGQEFTAAKVPHHEYDAVCANCRDK